MQGGQGGNDRARITNSIRERVEAFVRFILTRDNSDLHLRVGYGNQKRI
jgi:hypothetical protein